MNLKISTALRLLLLCVYSTTLSLPASAQPTLYVKSFLYVVDVASADESIAQIVDITNNGTELLQLKVEKTSCGCTGATLSNESVTPGQTVTLTIKMQVSGWGTKTETVTLSTNDPKQPHPVVTLQAKMPATVVPNPVRLTVQTHEGEAVQRFLSLLLPDKATVTSIVARNPYIRAKIIDSQPIEGGTLQRIEVSLDANVAAGELKDELTIQLNDAPVPQVGVAVDGMVTPDISVEPPQVFLGQISQGTTARKTILVQSYGKRPFSVAKIESSRAGVVGKADPKIIADAHAIEVYVTASGDAGSFLKDSVKVTLSNERVIEVPIAGMIVKADNILIEQTATPKVGSLAPDFTVTDSSSNRQKLSNLRGRKNVLLTFFPKCFTGGCAGHLASLQRELANFTNADTEIWAVSVDPSSEQVAFAAKLGLQFPLLPDTERTLSMLYGAAQNKSDMAARQSILIDKQGIVRWVDTDVHIQTNGADMLAKIKELGMAN